MADGRDKREQRKRQQDEVLWTLLLAGAAFLIGTWFIGYTESVVECVDRLHLYAAPKSEGSPTAAFDPYVSDYLDCLT